MYLLNQKQYKMTTIAPTPSLATSKSASTFLKVKRNAEKYISWYLVGNVFLGAIFSAYTGHWAPYAMISILVLTGYFGVKFLLPKSNLTLYLSSFFIGIFNIFFLYSTEGWFGAHFLIFVSAIVLIAFQEWKVFIPTYGLTLVYTLFCAYMQINNFEGLKLNGNEIKIGWGVVLYYQLVLGLFYTFCGVLANSLHQTTLNRVISYNKLESQIALLEDNLEIARSLSGGNYNIDIKSNQGDELGDALFQMAQSLKNAKAKEEHDRFISTGITEIGEILRQNMSDLNVLCEKIIFSLVNRLEANQGGIFLVQAEKNGEEYLELNSSCAYNRKKFLEKRIELRESLLGQAYLEKNIIHIDNIPEDYSSISSGLGETAPRHLIIVPLISNQKVVGVIEIASLKPFNDTKVEFIQRASESIASTIIFAKSNEETSRLLIQAEQMASELQAQEEEMRQNLEELQATQEEMKRAEKELKLKESNLTGFIDNTQSTIFALDTNYNITVVNSYLREKYQKRGIDLREGSHIFDIIPPEVHDYWKGRYDRAFQGERFQEVLKEGDAYVETLYNPIFNEDKEVIGASVTSFDVTEKRNSEQQLRQKEHELETILNQISSSVLVLDANFDVSLFNLIAQERLRKDGLEIEVGSNFIECFKGHPLSQIWKSWIEDVFNSGESVIKSTNRGTDEHPIFINVEIFPVRNLENEIEHVGIFGVDITADKTKMLKAQRELNILKQAFEGSSDNTIIVNNNFIPEFKGATALDLFDKNDITLESGLSLEESNNEEELSKLKTAFERALRGNEFSVPAQEIFEVTDTYTDVRFKALKSDENIVAVSISIN